jgi:xylulokinase
MARLFAGLDVSTQSCKLVVIDHEKKEVVFQTVVNYDTDLPHFHTQNGVCQGLTPGVSESEPVMWLEAVDMAFARLQSSAVPQEKILAISVSGQQHGLVALDEKGQLTRKRAKLWNDFSTIQECAFLTDTLGGQSQMIGEICNIQRTGYTAGKILHFKKNEPEAYGKTKTFFVVHNYINWYLTGGEESGIRVMEPGDTSGMALWNPIKKRWSQKLLSAIDSELKHKLPEVHSTTQMIGKIGVTFAKKFGLSLDCEIGAGSGDNMYGAIGTGNVVPGIVSVSLGTSGTAFTFLKEPFVDPTGEIACYCDSTGYYIPLLCVSNLANGYNEILRIYNWSHEDFSRALQKTKPGNDGRIMLPWFSGERTPDIPQAAPLYFGFGLNEFTKEYLCRGVLEGSILNLFNGFRRLKIKPDQIRLTGGLSMSHDWCQAIADIFEAVTIPIKGEGVALGAALHAAWVWLSKNRPQSIQDVVDPFVKMDESRRKTPNSKNVKVYRRHKELYNALCQRIQGKPGGNPFELRKPIIDP